MPYRRLPNTDQARLRALKTALKVGQETPPFKLAFSQNSMQKLKYFLPIFEGSINEQKYAFKNQTLKSKEYIHLTKKAKLYISHFIQVLNFAIARGEMPTSARKFYGITETSKKIPSLNTETSIISFGERIIKGEQERIANRANPITNPTVAVVRVHYEKFLEAYRYQKLLQETSQRALNKISDLRDEADKIILAIWNEVEESFSELTEDLKRENCQHYGLVYVYRSSEKKRMLKKAKIQTQKENASTYYSETSTISNPVEQSPLFLINQIN
jgi:hypothetical protein